DEHDRRPNCDHDPDPCRHCWLLPLGLPGTGWCRARTLRAAGKTLGVQLPPEELVHDLRISLALCLLHDLPDEVPEHSLLAAAVRLDLSGAPREDAVDERLELGRVGDRGLRENSVDV